MRKLRHSRRWACKYRLRTPDSLLHPSYSPAGKCSLLQSVRPGPPSLSSADSSRLHQCRDNRIQSHRKSKTRSHQQKAQPASSAVRSAPNSARVLQRRRNNKDLLAKNSWPHICTAPAIWHQLLEWISRRGIACRHPWILHPAGFKVIYCRAISLRQSISQQAKKRLTHHIIPDSHNHMTYYRTLDPRDRKGNCGLVVSHRVVQVKLLILGEFGQGKLRRSLWGSWFLPDLPAHPTTSVRAGT